MPDDRDYMAVVTDISVVDDSNTNANRIKGINIDSKDSPIFQIPQAKTEVEQPFFYDIE